MCICKYLCMWTWACITYRSGLDHLLRLDIHLHHHSLWCCSPLFPHCPVHPRPPSGPVLETSPGSPEPQTQKYCVIILYNSLSHTGLCRKSIPLCLQANLIFNLVQHWSSRTLWLSCMSSSCIHTTTFLN